MFPNGGGSLFNRQAPSQPFCRESQPFTLATLASDSPGVIQCMQGVTLWLMSGLRLKKPQC